MDKESLEAVVFILTKNALKEIVELYMIPILSILITCFSVVVSMIVYVLKKMLNSASELKKNMDSITSTINSLDKEIAIISERQINNIDKLKRLEGSFTYKTDP